jgi:SAM-dependent methyltransferase
MKPDYVFDEAAGVYCRPGSPPFPYSDSDEAEKRLLSIVTAASDLSSGSEELAAHITDWVSCYHLSPERSNLLRPFIPLLRGAAVLEVGCGCGALTRFLGENAATVAAVEGSPRRAQIAASRCAGLSNVRIYCDDFRDFSLDERFDLIVCVGVMEYSPVFFAGSDPFGQMLARLRDFLREDGRLLIAIENRLGLKYFAGAPEDHTGVLYQGLHGLYGPGSPATLGKREWEDLLRAQGFEVGSFWYPYPDYKFPTLIASTAALRDPDLDVGAILKMTPAGGKIPHPKLFSEQLVWPVLINNGLAEDLANSFLILTCKSGSSEAGWQAEGLLYHYSTSRRPQYAVEMSVTRQADGLMVRRNRLVPESPDRSAYVQAVRDEVYSVGVPYCEELLAVLNRPGWTAEQVARWAQVWVDDLRAASSDSDRGPLLPCDFMDRVPFNLIRRPTGELLAFDQEYASAEPIELGYVVFRGLWGSLALVGSCAPPAPEFRRRKLSEIAFEVMRELGCEAASEIQGRLITREAEFQEIITGVPRERAVHTLVQTRLLVRGEVDDFQELEQACPTCGVQLFWRAAGCDFSEAASSRARLDLVARRQSLRLVISPGLGPLAQLRFDPADRPGAARLSALRLVDSRDRPLWVWDGRTAALATAVHDTVIASEGEAATLLCLSNDPRILLSLPDELLAGAALKDGGALEVDLTWIAALDPAPDGSRWRS